MLVHHLNLILVVHRTPVDAPLGAFFLLGICIQIIPAAPLTSTGVNMKGYIQCPFCLPMMFCKATDNLFGFHSEASCAEALNSSESLCLAGALCLCLLRLQYVSSRSLALLHCRWWLEKCIYFCPASSCHCYCWIEKMCL